MFLSFIHVPLGYYTIILNNDGNNGLNNGDNNGLNNGNNNGNHNDLNKTDIYTNKRQGK